MDTSRFDGPHHSGPNGSPETDPRAGRAAKRPASTGPQVLHELPVGDTVPGERDRRQPGEHKGDNHRGVRDGDEPRWRRGGALRQGVGGEAGEEDGTAAAATANAAAAGGANWHDEGGAFEPGGEAAAATAARGKWRWGRREWRGRQGRGSEPADPSHSIRAESPGSVLGVGELTRFSYSMFMF